MCVRVFNIGTDSSQIVILSLTFPLRPSCFPEIRQVIDRDGDGDGDGSPK